MGEGRSIRRAARAAVALLVVLATAACADETTMGALRAEVASVQPPSGWEADGGVRYSCVGLNLDCQDAVAGLALTREGTVEEACSSVAGWVQAAPQLVGPVAVSGVGDRSAPDAAACASEIRERGRWLVEAESDVGDGVPASARWSVLLRQDVGPWRLDVVLGDPPTPFAPAA
ncbi:MAG: hypothetical protein AB7I24_04645 [Candidatus Nanopelagicales bacterium]